MRNFGPARVAVLVGLAVVGMAVLVSGFGTFQPIGAPGRTGVLAPTSSAATPAAPRSVSPSELAPEPQVDGVGIQVFNGTETLGLAASTEQLLVEAGYVAAATAADAPTKPISKTTVYFRPGDEAAQNKSDAEHLERTYLKIRAVVSPFAAAYEGVATDSATLLVVLGEDYADAQPLGT